MYKTSFYAALLSLVCISFNINASTPLDYTINASTPLDYTYIFLRDGSAPEPVSLKGAASLFTLWRRQIYRNNHSDRLVARLKTEPHTAADDEKLRELLEQTVLAQKVFGAIAQLKIE